MEQEFPSQAYVEAVIPPRVTVMGVRLEPLTLGHVLLLQRVGSPYAPFVEADRAPGVGDFLLALWICGQPWRRAARRLGTWRQALWMKWALFWCAVMRAPLLSRCAIFAAYLRENSRPPPFWHKLEGESATSGLPSLLAIRLALLEIGLASDEAWDTPLMAGLWEVVGAGARGGVVQMVSDHEVAIMRDMVRRREAAKAN
jgi:hypothetical protein